MKNIALVISLAASAALVGSALLAQDAANPDGGKAVKQGKAGVDKAAMTDEEKAAAKAAKQEAAKLGDIGFKMDKVVGGFSDDQKARIIDLNKAREEALKKINDKFAADAVALMTEEQKAKWQEAHKPAKKGDKGAAKAGAGDTDVSKEGGDAPK